MGFFWSGRNASVERIFKRSARYWITSYVGNCLWGPPGWRGARNPYNVGSPTFAVPDKVRYAGMSIPEIAREIGRHYGEMGAELGWSAEKIETTAWTEVKRVTGVDLFEGKAKREIKSAVPEIAATIQTAGQARRATLRSRFSGAFRRPAAVSRAGGLRGGATTIGV